MIILEDPYVSPELATFAADRQEPVLDSVVKLCLPTKICI